MLPRSSSEEDKRLELQRQAAEIASFIKGTVSKQTPVLVATHFDADGLSAGSLMLGAINRISAMAHLRVLESLNEKVLEEIEQVQSDVVIFTDMGSGYLTPMSKIIKNREIVIADHHQAMGEPFANLHHFNTHLMGFNGSDEISGAGTAYILAKALDPRNVGLSPLAIVGCLGDQQDKGPKRTLKGLNSEILRDAQEAKLVEVTQDLILFGRQTRPIHRAMAATTSPFLPGLSGEEDRCLALLDSANIPTKVDDRWRTISDLSLDEKRRIMERIIDHMISLKVSGEIALDLIGSVYTLTREEAWTPLRDGREYASLLNACGRMGRAGLGAAIGIGDRGMALQEAQSVYAEYKKWLSKYMNWLTSDPSAMVQGRHVVIVHGEGVIEENMTGAVSSLLSSSNLLGGSKVTLVTTLTKGGEAKISTRGTEQIVGKGVNLGRILQDLSPKHGGSGGGHAIAAGATVSRDELQNFLAEFESAINEVLG